MTTMKTRKPTHPGAVLHEGVLPQLGLTVSTFTRSLGISRQTLHVVLSERSGVSAELAPRLGTSLGNGANMWLDRQSRYDLRRVTSTSFPRCH